MSDPSEAAPGAGVPQDESFSPPLRKDWQRKEGWVIFHLASRALVERLNDITDEQLLSVLAEPVSVQDAEYQWHSIDGLPEGQALLAAQVCELGLGLDIDADVATYEELLPRTMGELAYNSVESGPIRQHLKQYNNWGNIVEGMFEPTMTMHGFPFNLLTVARALQPAELPALFNTMDDIVRIFRSPWFHEVLRRAALQPSNVWESFTTTPRSASLLQAEYIGSEARTLELGDLLDFSFEVDEHGFTTFKFSDTAAATLVDILATTNREAIERQREAELAGETYVEMGVDSVTSSGCLGAHDRPAFHSSDDVAGLAVALGISEEEVRAKAEHSPIVEVLLKMADTIERGAQLHETQKH